MVDRVVFKYDQAANEFYKMLEAANTLESLTNEIKNATNSIVGSGWVGKDAVAYGETVTNYAQQLGSQAQNMKEIVSLLQKHALESYEREIADARLADQLI